MNAHLLFSDRTMSLTAVNEQLSHDLELSCLIDHMADGDSFIRETAGYLFSKENLCRSDEEILYRQAIITDSINNPEDIRKLYSLVVRAVSLDRDTHLSISHQKARYMLDLSVQVMLSLQEPLGEIYRLSSRLAGQCRSAGFEKLCEGLTLLFAPDKLAGMKSMMEKMSIRKGISAVTVLSKYLKAEEYHPVLTAESSSKGILRFLRREKDTVEFDIDMEDVDASPSLARLKDDMLIRSAAVVVRVKGEMIDFLKELKRELSFLVGCLNLKAHMEALGLPLTLPRIGETHIENLYNLPLSLLKKQASVPNSLSMEDGSMLVITGSNQGGKTTFLRSLGQGLLMASAGMFASADAFPAAAGRVYTHFIREEDKTLKSGKLDEELLRMREITDRIRPGDWLLLNESFASTNEEEGSEIALEIITAMYDQGVHIACVTHFYHLVRLLKEGRPDSVTYLNAVRDDTGARTYRLTAGEPLVRGYGEDLYHEIFDQ